MEATKKKMGRPVIGKPKTVEIKTRIDEDLEKKVQIYCEEKKITRSDFLRNAINRELNKKQDIADRPKLTIPYQLKKFSSYEILYHKKKLLSIQYFERSKIMKKLAIRDSITSLELVEEINKFRKKENNKKELRHDNLLQIIRDEFEEEINVLEIQEVKYKDKKGELRPMFSLTLNQAKQVLMRESKYVRRAMIHYIEKLEQALIKSVNKEIELDNPRLQYEELIIEQVKGFLTKDGKKYELGVLAVSARQLWTKLEVKTYFTDWIKRRLERYNYQEDIDYIWYGDDYALTLDMASELSLIENTEIGRKLRSYIVNYEREYKKDEYEKQEELNDRIAMLEKIVLIPNSKNSTLTKDYTSIENMNGNLKTINYINDLIKEDFKAIQKIFNKIVSKEAEKALYIRQLENIVNSKI